MEPSEFLQIFHGNSNYLIQFLEYIYQVGFFEFHIMFILNVYNFGLFKSHISNSKLIVNTLLELYIKRINEDSSDEEASEDASDQQESKSQEKSVSIHEKKALEFLASNISAYDMNLALVICQLNNFKVNV